MRLGIVRKVSEAGMIWERGGGRLGDGAGTVFLEVVEPGREVESCGDSEESS
jgi:hypothetical protein